MSYEYEGHVVGYTETENGKRFRVFCSCGLGQPPKPGMSVPTRATEHMAALKCVQHLANVRKRKIEKGRRRGRTPYVPTKAVGTTLRIDPLDPRPFAKGPR
jgi:hypothetical protein